MRFLKLGVFLSVILFFSGCASEPIEKIEGITAELEITINDMIFDEAIIEAKITNETDKAFSGTVTVLNGAFNSWDIDVNLLAPNTTISRPLKSKYIEYKKQNFTYRVEGEFIESFETDVNYEIVYHPEGTDSYHVKVDSEVTEDIAISVVKDLYSKHGENLGRVAIYDSTLAEEINDESSVMPQADFYNNMLGYTLYFYRDDGSSVELEIELP